MQKLLAGCLVVLLLAAVAIGVGGYFLWRAATPMVESARELAGNVSRLGEVAEIDTRLTNTSRYDGPDSGELTADQVERFLRVQAHVRQTLGTRADAFKEKYKELGTTRPDGTEVPPSLPQLLTGLRDLSQIYLDARRAQVEALNAERFSREEFSWVRVRVYQAAGIEAMGYDAGDLGRALEAAARGAQLPAPEVRLPDAPARNRELVKPHAKQIAEWLAMASFGL